MGKKFYIGEIPEETLQELNEYGNASIEIMDEDVIDGDRLNHRVPKAGEIYFNVPEGWSVAAWNMSIPCIVLDPPKPKGDEWEKWVDDCPILKNEGMNEVLKNWFRVMPRKP